MNKTAELFVRFVEVVAKLRDPNGGCPWDLEQTHQTLRPYLIEEAYEVLEAIDSASDEEFAKELGDLLLQVVLHAQVARDRKAFSIDDVINAVTEKMIRRHPHVFGSTQVENSAQVLRNWEKIKQSERTLKKATENNSMLQGIPNSLPALLRAQRFGEKAAQIGFDWGSLPEVWAKVEEELSELQGEIEKISEKPSKALTTAPKSRDLEAHQMLESELGDLLFSVCQLSRWLGVSAEDALRGAISRFQLRFEFMEQTSASSLAEQNAQELDELWRRAKEELSKNKKIK